jgi:VanZ family protein
VHDAVIIVSFFVVMGIIYVLSDQTRPPKQEAVYLPVLISKIGHFFEYFLLTFLTYKLLWIQDHTKFNRNALVAFAFVTFFAFSDEVHQLHIAGRHGKIDDLFIDMFGSLVLLWVLQMEHVYQKKKKAVLRVFSV